MFLKALLYTDFNDDNIYLQTFILIYLIFKIRIFKIGINIPKRQMACFSSLKSWFARLEILNKINFAQRNIRKHCILFDPIDNIQSQKHAN